MQSELRHALDVLSHEHKKFETAYQLTVRSIMAYVEVGESIFFKSTFVMVIGD